VNSSFSLKEEIILFESSWGVSAANVDTSILKVVALDACVAAITFDFRVYLSCYSDI